MCCRSWSRCSRPTSRCRCSHPSTKQAARDTGVRNGWAFRCPHRCATTAIPVTSPSCWWRYRFRGAGRFPAGVPHQRAAAGVGGLRPRPLSNCLAISRTPTACVPCSPPGSRTPARHRRAGSAVLDGAIQYVSSGATEFEAEAKTVLELGERYPGDAGVLAHCCSIASAWPGRGNLPGCRQPAYLSAWFRGRGNGQLRQRVTRRLTRSTSTCPSCCACWTSLPLRGAAAAADPPRGLRPGLLHPH